MTVNYRGDVSTEGDSGEGPLAVLKGEWANESEGTHGLFGARQESQQGELPAPAC